jgi:hypothetical protein
MSNNKFEPLECLGAEQNVSSTTKASVSKSTTGQSTLKTPERRQQGMGQASPSHTTAGAQKSPPEVDEDGFTKVSSSRKKSPTNSPARAPAAPKAPSPASETPRRAPTAMIAQETRTPPKGAPAGPASMTLTKILPSAGRSGPAPRTVQKQQINNSNYSRVAARAAPPQTSPIQQAQPAMMTIPASAQAAEAFPLLPSTPKKETSAGLVVSPKPLTFPNAKQLATPSPLKGPENNRVSPKASPPPKARDVVVEIWVKQTEDQGAVLVFRDYPLKYLTARSEFFSEKYAGVATSTTGPLTALTEILPVKPAALRCVLSWFKKYTVTLSPGFDRKPQIITREGKCTCTMHKNDSSFQIDYQHHANLYQVTQFLRLTGPFANQFALRKSLTTYFDTKPFANEHVIYIWNCCKSHERLASDILWAVAKSLERADDATRQKSFAEDIKDISDLDKAYQKTLSDLSKAQEYRQQQAEKQEKDQAEAQAKATKQDDTQKPVGPSPKRKQNKGSQRKPELPKGQGVQIVTPEQAAWMRRR